MHKKVITVMIQIQQMKRKLGTLPPSRLFSITKQGTTNNKEFILPDFADEPPEYANTAETLPFRAHEKSLPKMEAFELGGGLRKRWK